MNIETFEDFEEQPCKYCGKLTVCLLMFRGRKIFVCVDCVEERLKEKVVKA